MLTVAGYSINATIVIFDRIRDSLKNAGERVDYKQLVNESITYTLTRSINTSLTTLIMIVALFIFGVASIREFALPLMVGIVVGGYSSVFITGALWIMLRNFGEKNAAKAKERQAQKVEADLSNSKKKKKDKKNEQ